LQTKRLTLTILAALMTVAAPVAFGEVKLAVVDVQSAILNSEDAKRLLAQIQTEFKGDEDKIRKLQSDAAVILERMQKDADVMSETEKRRLQAEIESLNSDFQYQRQRLQRQIDDRQKELFAGVDQKVQRAIEELVKSESYNLIIPRQAALYVGDVYDVTRKVTEKLNQFDADANKKK
jgi:outer membrane protein